MSAESTNFVSKERRSGVAMAVLVVLVYGGLGAGVIDQGLESGSSGFSGPWALAARILTWGAWIPAWLAARTSLTTEQRSKLDRFAIVTLAAAATLVG